MQDYINHTLGCKVETVDFTAPKSFPLYLKNSYSYAKYCIEGQQALFVTPADFILSSYKKHRTKIEELTSLKTVLCIDSITPYQRKALIEEHIPFVVKNSQIYLPFLAICLSEKYDQKSDIEKFSPITQLVFLYIFYNAVKLTATEISKKLHCTIMSASRAYKELMDCGLFNCEQKGRNKYITPRFYGGELLKAAEPYLINPVEKICYFKYEQKFDNYHIAGISALARKTMLSVSEHEQCYAALKKHFLKSPSVITKAEYLLIGGTKFELWSYDPCVLTKDRTVDDISLILSLDGETDERILWELENLRRKYQW